MIQQLLKINDTIIDIDEQTAIGINLQTYDIKEPGKRKVSTSNSFTIPPTSNNLFVIGFAGDPQTNNTKVYDAMYCDYWLENEHLIKNAKVRIQAVQERIELFVFQKPDVWDELKLLTWPVFQSEFLEWLQDEKSYPSVTSPITNNFGVFLDPYTTNTEGLIIPMMYSNLYNYEPDGEGTGYLEDENNLWVKFWPDTADTPSNGGHFCAFMKTIFEFIEWKYDVNFLTAGGEVDYNLWDDAYATKIYVPVRDIDVKHLTAPDRFYFDIISSGEFSPETDMQAQPDKTLYDCVNAFFQHLNVIKDDVDIDGEMVIALHRFDDIENIDTNKFSGKIQGKPKFISFVEGFAQKNIIKFTSVFPNGNPLTNAKVITCLNKNIDAENTLFEIDAYIPSFVAITGGVIPDMSIPESFETFTFFINDELTDNIINIKLTDHEAVEQVATSYLYKAALYGLDNEYNFLEDIIARPKFYEIEKWLTLNDIKAIEFFKQRYIQELNGSFFINKISGFNPGKSNSPTKLEVIWISSKVAIDMIDLEFYVDGLGNVFTDGLGNEFF